MKNLFSNIFLDITNYCNARCPFCQSGKNKPERKVDLQAQDFQSILENLKRGGGLSPSSVISLYNWSEPFLHSDLGSLLKVLHNFGLSYAFSTNASILPKVDETFCRGLSQVIFSMSGFSQASYDRIHGFRFSSIRENILAFVAGVRRFNPHSRFFMSFHVYQFNVAEVQAAHAFALKNQIAFFPVYAILNDWFKIQGYIERSLSFDQMKLISESLFAHHWGNKWIPEKAPFACPQYNNLVIDEKGNLLPCCQVPKGLPQYSYGNLLKDEFSRIIQRQKDLPVCQACASSGLAHFINSSLQPPEFFSPAVPTTPLQRLRGLLGKLKHHLFSRKAAFEKG